MKKIMMAAFAVMTLLLVPAVSVSAQTVTIDAEGPEYTGDYLLTWNTQTKLDGITYDGSATPDKSLDDSWEATGIIGAAGAKGAAADASSVPGEAQPSLSSMENFSGNSVDLTKASEKTVYKTGDTHTFSSYLYYKAKDGKPADFTARCIAATDSCTIWYSSVDKTVAQLSEKDVTGLQDKLQKEAGIIEKYYGDSDRIDVDSDGKIAVVFYPFNGTASDGCYIASDLKRNGMDMLNLNTRYVMNGKLLTPNDAAAITANEWQHLVNDSQTGCLAGLTAADPVGTQYDIRSYSWLNESFSQSSVGLNGYANSIIRSQALSSSNYMKKYGNTLSLPFVFQGLYMPQGQSIARTPYAYWFLFGRYLSAQTDGYSGGGDSIYKRILNFDRENYTDPDTGAALENVGKCDNRTLEKTLADIGYLGTGIGAKARNLDEMMRNFIIATYLRQGSGVYSLGGLKDFDLSSLSVPKVCTAVETPQKLPGGYSSCLTKINCSGSILVDENAAGTDIRHAGIKITYDGVKGSTAKNSDGTMTVTLSTTDKNVEIYYTINGDLPSRDHGTRYTGPFTLPQGTPVMAVSADAWGESAEWANSVFHVAGFAEKNRYATAAKVVMNDFPDGSDTAILVSGENWPDALSAASLAGVRECPILITQKDLLTQATSDLIYNLGVSHVIILGGTGSVSKAVENALTAKNGIPSDQIERISGRNRIETAEETEKAVMTQSRTDTCFICSGNNFPDGLSAAPYAAKLKAPILLTRHDGTLSEVSLAMAKSFAKIYIVGSAESVSSKVEGQLSSVGAAAPKRLAGRNRYGTNAAVINTFCPEGIDILNIVTGGNFPDALVAAVSYPDSGYAFLLVNGKSGSLTKEQISIIRRLHVIDGAATIGGEGSLSAATRAAINDAVINDPLAQMTTVYSAFMERKTTAEPNLRTVDEFPGLICEKCTFASDKGTALAGYKYSKKNLVPKGVIIMAHGFGPGGQCVYMDQADYFTSNGYLVFSYDATGTDRSGGDSCIGMQQGILDLDKAIEYVKADSVMKNLPIGLYGHSWGAYCVSAALEDHPEVRAVAEISGFNDTQDQFNVMLSQSLGSLTVYYTWYVEMMRFGKTAFYTGIKGFDSTEADILVIHSADDANVPISLGYDKYYEKYKDSSRFTFERYTDKGHLYIFYTAAARKYDEAYDNARAVYFAKNGLQNTTENRNAYYKNHPFDKKTGFELDTDFMGNILAFFDKNIQG